LGEPVVMILAAVADGRPHYLVLVSKELTERGLDASLDANTIVRVLAREVRGAGGGRPDFAQGGGGDPARLAAGLERARAAAEPGPAP
ncbi:MAG TPA: DHHA1 domain-containing protein, partial [Chloroflexota bacterium]|nr:DHHA1 domain-containing protein [Chloroflexota bacterium]